MAQFAQNAYLQELAWAAGLFDGEGTVGLRLNGVKQGQYRRIGLRVGMTDKDTVERFADVLGLVVTGPRLSSKYPNAKAIWEVRVDNFAGVQAVMCFLWLWLSPFRREQFKKAILWWLSHTHRANNRARNFPPWKGERS